MLRHAEDPTSQRAPLEPVRDQRGDFVAVVNETFAQRYLDGHDVIGQQLRSDVVKNDGRAATITSPHSAEWRQILGVVADYRNDGLERPQAPTIFVPYSTFMWNSTQFFIRTAGSPEEMLRPLRSAVHVFNPDQRISGNKI